MKALTKVLAGSVVVAAMAAAAPAVAQYYPYGGGYATPPMPAPGYGYGYGNPGGNYGVNQQAVINQCTAAVQQRLGGYGSGYSAYGAGRVLGISRVEPRGDGGLQVSGVASSGAYGAYSQEPDLTFRCRTDYRGVITWVDVKRAQRAYRPYDQAPYGNVAPNGYNTGPYGYSRY